MDQDGLIVDAYVGAKYWYMDNSSEVKPAILPQNHVQEAQSWVEGVVGGQVRGDITDRVFLNASGFVGTGGSKFYGDVYGTAGYHISRKWDAFVGSISPMTVAAWARRQPSRSVSKARSWRRGAF